MSGVAGNRRVLLGVGLALAIGLTWYSARFEDAEADLPVKATRPAGVRADVAGAAGARDRSGKAAPGDPGRIDLDRMARGAEFATAGDPFKSLSWAQIEEASRPKPPPPPPPPPPSVAIAPPAPPPPPPLPFTYLGRMQEGDTETVFLAHGQRNLAVARGETVDQTWRVEAISESAVDFTYIPQDARQRLTIRTQQ